VNAGYTKQENKSVLDYQGAPFAYFFWGILDGGMVPTQNTTNNNRRPFFCFFEKGVVRE